MNVIKNKRLLRKRNPWIKHKFSVWYRRKLALGIPLAMVVAAQAYSQLVSIKATPAKTGLDKINKIKAIAELSVAWPDAITKAHRYFVDSNG